MTNNYKCSGCGVDISADPELTKTVQCGACFTILSLAPPSASNYMDYQCPGCGMSHTADPLTTPELHCPSCMTHIKLGQAQPQIGQGIPNPPVPNPPASEPSIPQLGGAATPAAESSVPNPSAAEPSIPQLGGAAIGGMPQLGGAAKKPLPEPGPVSKDEFPTPELGAANNLPAVESQDPGTLVPESGEQGSDMEPTTQEPGIGIPLGGNTQIEEQPEDKVRPAWQNFLLQPRVLAVILGIAPVMITVIVGAILVFIRCGTGIANGEGDMVNQSGQIVLGLIALWAMYIIGMTFYFADRDWVTDMGLFIVILGAGWGMYAVVTTFPSTFLAIVKHLFFGYVSLVAIGLAIWLLAPYKGIGSPR